MKFPSLRVTEVLPGQVLRRLRPWARNLCVASVLLHGPGRGQAACAHPHPSLRGASVERCCLSARPPGLHFHRTRPYCVPGSGVHGDGCSREATSVAPSRRDGCRTRRAAGVAWCARGSNVRVIRANSVQSRARPRAALIYEPIEVGCEAKTDSVGRGSGSRAMTAAPRGYARDTGPGRRANCIVAGMRVRFILTTRVRLPGKFAPCSGETTHAHSRSCASPRLSVCCP